MKCYNHDDTEAIGVCTSCGKAVCEKCGVFFNNKLLCKSCLSNPIVKKPGSSDLFNTIMRFFNIVIGALWTGILVIGLLYFFLKGNIWYALLCLFFMIGGINLMYEGLTKSKVSVWTSIISISLFTVLLIFGIVLLL